MDKKKLKIVYLIPGGLYSPGGTDRITTIKANYLSEKMGYDVSAVTTEQLGRPVYFPISEKVHLYHLDIGIHANFGKENYLQKCISRYFKTRQYKKELNELLHKIQPDITVSLLGLDIEFLNDFKDGSIKIGELHFPGNFRQLMARKLSNRFIPNFVAKIRTNNMKKACRKLARLIVLTEEEKIGWKNVNNIEVIPNALSFFPKTTSSCDHKKAIAVGRLAYEKGFDQLIESWKTVYEKHPGWELNIFGGGDQEDNLQHLIVENNLESVVKIHPPSKDIYSQYLGHSLMLFPSRYLEALPMVLLEAMSCGLPIVAFDAPCGPKDILTDGRDGFLVEAGDKAALSEKICQLIESDELRKSMGKSAGESAFKYSEDKIMNHWIHLFETLTKKG
ncbi:glycosyl transferase [Bacteroidia bacterium]|nr:glycosyl transferase [Bacteroidia bacterium]GHV70750.1 glycosyl transferase [Bacteroidia bacterium]